jgi:Holliday junction resolvase-like predicted endonuclease
MTKPPPPDRSTIMDAAQATLQQAGYRVLDHDWTSDSGQHQLDLIAEAPGKALVAVRVLAPSRADTEHRARTMAKSHIRQLRQAAVAWATAHGRCYGVVQVDVIGLALDGHPVHVKAVS